MSAKLDMAGITDTGKIRDHNEDRIGINSDVGLAILADGMGGHQAGEVASGMAVDLITWHLAEAFNKKETKSKGKKSGNALEAGALREAIELANSAIYELSHARSECAGMGATVVVAVFHNDKICIGHLGDSRVYRFRNDKLTQMTEDHSMVQELVNRGLMTGEEARSSLNKNLVTRALGVDEDADPNISEQKVFDKDIFLLCSDGLNDVLSDSAIEEILAQYNPDLNEAANKLVNEVNEQGGPDNVSIILIRTGDYFVRSKDAVKKLQNMKPTSAASDDDNTIDLD